jgi:hypothetical protein
MAEVKNAFIKSKMNKDLDSRLLPPGEYRNGQNIQVSKSEGEDVGALENALGNTLTTNFNVQAANFLGVDVSTINLKSIGFHTDVGSSTIFIFLTDNDDNTYVSTGDQTYNKDANNFIYAYNTSTEIDPILLVYGAFLNFSQSSPIHGVNLLENLLFWTDNRNQPRKINWELANGSYYTSEDTISVSKYNPYQVMDLYYGKNGTFYTSMQDVVSAKLPNGEVNPFKNKPQGVQIVDQNLEAASWPGDPDYLQDKFVRFSYRFKFTDGEYSIMAPFTQPAFVPKQDGYFLAGDEDSSFRSTVVGFMENKVNNVGLFLPLPYTASSLNSTLDVSEIDILYKESDGLAVKVLESIGSDVFRLNPDDTVNTSTTYIYQYQSRKAYKTLPESEIIRVFDRVPVKALGQEVISNRIVYSNFQDKHTPPVDMNYNVAANNKYVFNNNTNYTLKYTSEIEYPMHTLKQNRNYQVGFILSDRYGRQSTVVLSPVGNEKGEVFVEGGITYSGSTFYHPYKVDPGSANDINSWPGDSLKIIISGNIHKDHPQGSSGYPGLWNGDPTSSDYNPLGWYSYKVVVKQTQQDYYNVYLPGILNGYPDNLPPASDTVNTIAHITLINDNINKVPRNLTEVGPEQKQYGSSVELFGRVTPNFTTNTQPTVNQPYYPQTNVQTVVTIAQQDNLFSAAPPFSTVYQTDSNPYIARLSQGNVSSVAASALPLPIGSATIATVTGAYKIILGVFETKAVESFLDIFYETSTSGLISDYNAASDTTDANGFNDFDWDQYEDTEPNVIVTFPRDTIANPGFYPTLPGLIPTPILDNTVSLVSVTRGPLGNQEDITSNWKPLTINTEVGAITPRTWDLTTNVTMYRGINDVDNWFTFNFLVTDNTTGGVNPITVRKKLKNMPPTWVSLNSKSLLPTRGQNDSIYDCVANNGALFPNFTSTPITANLTYEIVSQTPDLGITIVNDAPNGTAKLFQTDLSASGLFNLVLKVTDSGPNSAFLNLSIVFGKQQMNPSFGSGSGSLSEGLQSTGLFWADEYSNVYNDLPAAVNADATSLGWQATATETGLVLPANGFDTFPRTQKLQATGKGQGSFGGYVDYSPSGDGEGYQWINTLKTTAAYNPLSTPATGNSLSTGTAYIKLDFKFKSWGQLGGTVLAPQINAQFGAVWPCYLQYRENSTSTWITATDIEGQPMRTGKTQRNITLSGGSSSNNVNYDRGVIVDNTKSGTNQDEVQVTSVFAGSSGPNSQPTAATASMIFVFGQDQSYDLAQNNKFGEYRLLLRYPRDLQGGNQTDYVAIPKPVNNQSWEWPLNPFVFRGHTNIALGVNVQVSYGDFYYGANNNASGYLYNISDLGFTDVDTASSAIVNPQPVFAKEWAFKYVTQFYTDSQMSIPWIPAAGSSGNFHCFTGRGNVVIGSENSNNTQNDAIVDASNFENNNTLDQRRWVAQFDSTTGKKISGTAVPSVGNIPL